MVYLLDANVLIDANRDYYPIERVPEFWEWLVYQGDQNSIRIALETFGEVAAGRPDDLTDWARSEEVKTALLLNEEPSVERVSEVVSIGYATDLTDEEIEKLGLDPIVISYALSDSRCVVTTEVSKPSQRRSNRRIPDVCERLGIDCCNTFELMRRLNFSTNWQAR